RTTRPGWTPFPFPKGWLGITLKDCAAPIVGIAMSTMDKRMLDKMKALILCLRDESICLK
ncbi:MAG: hypothetical protein K2O61_02040, partial [Bacteroidaceae bacterium]|nr:hypothetical protein [Bacteroidaceae bacterium]